ncbi:MAG TPA: hypothetical protein VI758_01470, partial [Bacteroidota bacterium]
MVLSLLIVLTVATAATFGQSINPVTINNFDAARDSTTWMAQEGGTSWSIAVDSTDKVVGSASWKVHANLGAIHEYGTYAQFGHTLPDTATPWDWSLSDTVSIWINVRMPASNPSSFFHLRLQIADKPTPGDAKEEWIYENSSILYSASGWVNL